MTQAAMTIVDRIARAQPALSRKQHKMAEYVLAHPFRVVTMTIEAVSYTHLTLPTILLV